MISLANVCTAMVPAACLAAYALLIGFGLQAALATQARFATSLGVVCGVGLAVAAVAMCLAHVLLGNATLPLTPLAVLALMAIALRAVAIRRQGQHRLPEAIAETLRTITPLDGVAAAAATVLLLPLLHHGLTYWTTGTPDFPNYAASAQIWATSPAAFADIHPDPFGQLQLERASFEKPMVTALLVALSTLSGVPPFQLLAPTMLLFLYVFLACSLTLCASIFRLGPFVTVVAVLPAGVALVPMSRVYDAQPGQVVAVALIACLFAIVAAGPVSKTSRSTLALALVAGLVWAATVGANFTLVVGSGLALAALLVWTLSQQREHFVERLKLVATSTAILVFLSIPMLGMYWTSFSGQTTGEPGFDIPLVLPLAVIGQQLSLAEPGPTSQALLSWFVTLLSVLAAIWLRAATDRRAAFFDLALFAAVVANVLVIGLKFGWINYAVHKWVALATAVVMPPVISYSVSLLGGRIRSTAVFVLTTVALSSTLISLNRARSVNIVVNDDLMSLHANGELAAEPQLNLKLRGTPPENMIAALIMPSSSVVMTDATYAQGAPPRGSRFLVRNDQLERAPHSEVIQLNDSYALASLNLTLQERSVDFTKTDHPEVERFLFGRWYAIEPGGIWSGQLDNYLVFDLPPDLRNRDISVAVKGHAFANAQASQKIEVQVNGSPMLELLYPDDIGKVIEFVVPAAMSEAVDGRITINFRAFRPLSPSAYGSADRRSLAFMLTRLEVAPI